jgi:hypothetical protein
VNNKEILDISFRNNGLSKELSNLYPYIFYMDKIKFESFEGFIQSLRTNDIKQKQFLWNLSGFKAWKYGQQFDWITTQKIYWLNKEIDRCSEEYTILIENAYNCLLKNEQFKNKLLESLPFILDHTVGYSDKTKTLLTKKEYLDNLNRLRNKIKPPRFFNIF